MDKFEASVCSGTRLIESAQESLQELGDGKPPTNSGADYIPQTSNKFQNILTVSGIVIFLLILVVLIIRHYRE